MNVFEKLGCWTLGEEYSDHVLTSIEVNPDQTVTLGLDYGKIFKTFEYVEAHQHWSRISDKKSNQALLGTPLSSLPFRKRTEYILRVVEVDTIGELIEKSEDDFVGVRNCGRVTIRDINEVLSDHGLSLKPITRRKRRV